MVPLDSLDHHTSWCLRTAMPSSSSARAAQLLVGLCTIAYARVDDDLDLEKMDAALQSSEALFVKFEAPWCGHCKRLSPVWETMLGLDLDGARLGTVDCTRQDQLRIRYGIRSYPTLMLFAEGQIKLFSGERSLPELSKFARGGWRKAPDHTLKPLTPSEIGRSRPRPPTTLTSTLAKMRKPQEWSPIVKLATAAMLLGMIVQLVVGCYYFVFDREKLKKRPYKKSKRKAIEQTASEASGADGKASAAAGSQEATPSSSGKEHAE